MDWFLYDKDFHHERVKTIDLVWCQNFPYRQWICERNFQNLFQKIYNIIFNYTFFIGANFMSTVKLKRTEKKNKVKINWCSNALPISCHRPLSIYPWKYQKTFGFLIVSGDMERDQGMKYVKTKNNVIFQVNRCCWPSKLLLLLMIYTTNSSLLFLCSNSSSSLSGNIHLDHQSY